MNIPTKDELISKWAWEKPLIYQAIHLQSLENLSDEEMYRFIIAALLDENAYYHRVIERYTSNHVSPIVRINV